MPLQMIPSMQPPTLTTRPEIDLATRRLTDQNKEATSTDTFHLTPHPWLPLSSLLSNGASKAMHALESSCKSRMTSYFILSCIDTSPYNHLGLLWIIYGF